MAPRSWYLLALVAFVGAALAPAPVLAVVGVVFLGAGLVADYVRGREQQR